MTLWLSLFTALLACVIFFFVYQIHECKKGIACTLEILYRDAIQIGRRLEQMPTQADFDAAAAVVNSRLDKLDNDIANKEAIPQAAVDAVTAIADRITAIDSKVTG